ncbi:MAG: hypothetical protein IKP41_01505 [Bacteroidaceae bacterium]|nr:hypothetical protein [Bacteroidaceae bacterium]
MNYNNTYAQKTAGIIRYSCALLFMLFSFCYLFFLQGEILAEAQYVYSHGVTSYNILIGAIIITVVLQIFQWIVSLLSRLPARWHAFSYMPSMLLLAILSDVNKEAIAHFSFGAWLWIAPVLMVVYVLIVILLHNLCTFNSDSTYNIKSQIYPNFIILFFLMLTVGAIPQTTDVYHYELKAERLILDKDYAAAAAVGETSLRASARLTQLRMYALSKEGQLAERLFDYPQYYGSRGLLDVADTSSLQRFTTQDICLHLGALCGKSIHSTDRYMQLLLAADSLCNQHTADYYLCGLLLDKKLKEFQRELPRHYNLSDSIVGAYDKLPRAYREALYLIGKPSEALDGKIVVKDDTLAVLSDFDMLARFRDYNELKASLTDETERINRTHREFGNTYWWYYDYSHLSTGELAPRNDK